jgi:hypothetical protein
VDFNFEVSQLFKDGRNERGVMVLDDLSSGLQFRRSYT